LNTESHFVILLISDSLVESLAEADCELNDRNAIVASIANITITTISSTNVNPELFLIAFHFGFMLLFAIDIILKIK
jgi:hypothetical protein